MLLINLLAKSYRKLCFSFSVHKQMQIKSIENLLGYHKWNEEYNFWILMKVHGLHFRFFSDKTILYFFAKVQLQEVGLVGTARTLFFANSTKTLVFSYIKLLLRILWYTTLSICIIILHLTLFQPIVSHIYGVYFFWMYYEIFLKRNM